MSRATSASSFRARRRCIEPRAQDRVGEQPHAVQLDEDGRVADVHDPHGSGGHEPVIVCGAVSQLPSGQPPRWSTIG